MGAEAVIEAFVQKSRRVIDIPRMLTADATEVKITQKLTNANYEDSSTHCSRLPTLPPQRGIQESTCLRRSTCCVKGLSQKFALPSTFPSIAAHPHKTPELARRHLDIFFLL